MAMPHGLRRFESTFSATPLMSDCRFSQSKLARAKAAVNDKTAPASRIVLMDVLTVFITFIFLFWHRDNTSPGCGGCRRMPERRPFWIRPAQRGIKPPFLET